MKTQSLDPTRVTESGAEHHLPPGLRSLFPKSGPQTKLPIFLVGACERHNFGDMLMPHIVERQLRDRESTSCVGLIDADLREDGGHRVLSCETAFEKLQTAPTIVHFGGATLGCDLASGYSMVSSGQEHTDFMALLRQSPEKATEFAQERTGFKGNAAYVVDAQSRWENAVSAFHGVGLSEPEKLNPCQQTTLLDTLERSDFVGIRDADGADFLEENGINIERMPCGVAAIQTLCRSELIYHGNGPALNAVREKFTNGWVAVQVSGYRKKLLKPLIKALAEKCARMKLGVVFFAAGTAPGHDNVIELARQAENFPGGQALFFPSRNIWDISALIGNSKMYIGTSLHGRIVAMSAGIPRINLAARFAKIQSYCRLWEHPSIPYELQTELLGEHFENLLEVDQSTLKTHAEWLEETYFEAFSKMCRATHLERRSPFPASLSAHSKALKYSSELIGEWSADEKTLRMLKRISKKKSRLKKNRRLSRTIAEAAKRGCEKIAAMI